MIQQEMQRNGLVRLTILISNINVAVATIMAVATYLFPIVRATVVPMTRVAIQGFALDFISSSTRPLSGVLEVLYIQKWSIIQCVNFKNNKIYALYFCCAERRKYGIFKIKKSLICKKIKYELRYSHLIFFLCFKHYIYYFISIRYILLLKFQILV